MFEQDNLHAQNYSFRFVFVSKRTGCGRFGHAAIAVALLYVVPHITVR